MSTLQMPVPMNTRSFSYAVIFFAVLSSCKKDAFEEKPTDSGFLVEGPLSAYFGRQIDVPQSERKWIWGRNSTEIFSSRPNTLIRVDLAKNEKQEVSGLSTLLGQNNDNTGILFEGNINGVEGHYLFNYETNQPECIQSFLSQGWLRLAGNSIAVAFWGSVPAPGRPCLAPWDFWCRGFVPQQKTVYLYTKNNPAPFAFKEKGLEGFTKDGTRAVLNQGGLINGPNAFLFVDVQTGAITDSIPRLESEPYFIDHVIRSVFWNGTAGTLTVKNASSGQVLKSFNLNRLVPADYFWSSDGTKICLVLYDSIAGNYAIKILDYDTGKATHVLTFPYHLFLDNIRLSNDNQRLILQPGDKVNPLPNPPYYIKDIVY